ncbi:flagellar biosynthetic protein FliQ [Salipiger pallidus]|uniref:Flagellar biosynthetic protein FliQ n=1 Tax=Salipiger pallidus TaxID=1775170 RepID=A0A8J2ZN85_9RHOB|nr:flagellar biosynthetic protein FliQ [Salipiger pallidus]GGG84109.1 flagellar biosynthetic protein FliQ [Salipiger pallidus]
MSDTSFVGYLFSFMLDAAILAGVPLAVATLVGLIVSIFQAVTQIQDQSLSQTVKIAAIGAVLLAFGGVLVAPLMTDTQVLFDSFSATRR